MYNVIYITIIYIINNGFASAICTSSGSQDYVTFLLGFKALQANVPFLYL